MKEDRTAKQIYTARVNAINKAHAKGWVNIFGWVFVSPSDSRHDLSAANLNKLNYIEKNKLMLK